MRLPAIEDLNRSSESQFGLALRPLFEAAPSLLRALYVRRPFTSYEHVIDAAESVASFMSPEDQRNLLSAHPRIGANPAEISALSHREQGYDAEASLQRAELERVYARLEELNRQYEEHFGFRFVVFVNKRPKSQIVEVLEERLNNAPDAELRSGLRDMFLIARDRLASLQPA